MLIVAGLYSVLWGKYKEYKEKEIEESIIPEAVKGVIKGNNQMVILANIEGINDIEMQKSSEGKRIEATSASVAISFPMPHPQMLAREAPKGLI